AAKAPPRVPPIRFTGDAGFVSTSGNSSVQTLNLGNKVSARIDRFTISQQFGLVHGRSKGATVASSWRASMRTDMVLHDAVAAYASVTYERNRFAGLASRIGTVAGLSAQVL